MNKKCLTEEQMMELYYNEDSSETLNELKQHMTDCKLCQKSFSQFCQDLMEIEFPVIECSNRVIDEAISLIENSDEEPSDNIQQQDILTVDEAASLLKVQPHNVLNMLHKMPYFTFDNEIRFLKSELINFIAELGTGADERAPRKLHENIIFLKSRKAG